jgi:hypothetical protein
MFSKSLNYEPIKIERLAQEDMMAISGAKLIKGSKRWNKMIPLMRN